MSIRFIPNDPRAGAAAPAIRVQARLPARAAGRSKFSFAKTSPEGLANPGSPQFLYWQVREAALLALRAWEASAGPHKAWQGGRKILAVIQDAGQDLNAYYDRASLAFFHQTVANIPFFSGASTDVVAHEVGHGLLDSIRPDLWDVSYLEAGALHEAFGDCIAILTALNDRDTRNRLLAGSVELRRRNFVETTAEDLSKGIGLLIPGHNAAEPRHAFNAFKYQLPSSLPSDGGPGALINEVHSFGMIFSACFWDLIANLFDASRQRNEASLLVAAQLAGEILIAGVKSAVVTPRFFQSVGRAMTLADQSLHGGVHHAAIRDAFGRHNILLGSNALIAPSMALSGQAPKGAALAAATRKDLLQRMGSVRGAKLEVSGGKLFGVAVVNAVQTRAVSLSALHPRLKGVVAMTHETVTIGGSGGRAVVVGAMPHGQDTDSEIHEFVASLIARRRIDLGDSKASRASKASKPGKTKNARGAEHPPHLTHTIKNQGGKRVLRRIKFSCFCCPPITGASQPVER